VTQLEPRRAPARESSEVQPQLNLEEEECSHHYHSNHLVGTE